jgi:hypothetical protein
VHDESQDIIIIQQSTHLNEISILDYIGGMYDTDSNNDSDGATKIEPPVMTPHDMFAMLAVSNQAPVLMPMACTTATPAAAASSSPAPVVGSAGPPPFNPYLHQFLHAHSNDTINANGAIGGPPASPAPTHVQEMVCTSS